MSIQDAPTSGLADVKTVDIKVGIAELPAVRPFWLQAYPAHYTFADLQGECLNQPDVAAHRESLERVPASRHFWCGERMALKGEPVAAVVPAGFAGTVPQISLVLRRDRYQLRPLQYLVGGKEHPYLAAEAPIGQIIHEVLSREERECCFDLCDSRGRRLPRDRTLAACGLMPAWEDLGGAVPSRAVLRLRPRISWLPYLLLLCIAVCGVYGGYALISYILARH